MKLVDRIDAAITKLAGPPPNPFEFAYLDSNDLRDLMQMLATARLHIVQLEGGVSMLVDAGDEVAEHLEGVLAKECPCANCQPMIDAWYASREWVRDAC